MGPPIGGIIVTYASWRWIFCQCADRYARLLSGDAIYPQYTRDARTNRSTCVGFILIALALAGSGVRVRDRGAPSGTAVPSSPDFRGVGFLCSLLYLRHIRRIDHPIIDLSLFKYPTYRASLTGGSLYRIAIGALPFLLPLLMQYGFGMTPAMSGFVTLASAAGAVLMKICATADHSRHWLSPRS